jgi:hypothetical protein
MTGPERLTRTVRLVKRVARDQPATYWPTLLTWVAFVVVAFPLRTYLMVATTCTSPPILHSGDTHYHHELIGIGLLLLAGFLWVNGAPDRLMWGRCIPFAAILFGAGAALVLDETTLLVTLNSCTYYSWMNVLSLVAGGLLLVPHFLIHRALYGRMFAAAARGLRGPTGG